MIKKLIPLFVIVSLFVGYPASTFAATTTTSTTKSTTTAKAPVKKATTAKKAPAKKKVVKKKKERLILQPAKFTLQNAPHSPKPVAKSKSKAKKPATTKKTS